MRHCLRCRNRRDPLAWISLKLRISEFLRRSGGRALRAREATRIRTKSLRFPDSRS
jgi:hypothetical protein